MTSPSRARRPLVAITGLGVAAAITLLIACEAPMPDQALPTAVVSRIAPASHPQLGDTVARTVVVNGVTMTVRNVIFRINKAGDGQGEESGAAREKRPKDTTGYVTSDSFYVYYAKDGVRVHDEPVGRP